MKTHLVRAGANVVCLAVALAILMPLSTPIGAQRTDPARVRMEEDNKRETQLQVRSSSGKLTDPKQLQAAIAQVEQDFKQILILHNEIARATAADKALDYRFVSEATAEIKKRASRLQTTLALNRPEAGNKQEKQVKFVDAQVKDALVALCNRIESFVKNPVIESPGTVDLEQSARAQRDLDSIIDLSGNIKKSAERLRKSPR
jgi:NAD(P)-dependent dehydrogenase (short-subunit alcohol dehydrogenase family)